MGNIGTATDAKFENLHRANQHAAFWGAGTAIMAVGGVGAALAGAMVAAPLAPFIAAGFLVAGAGGAVVATAGAARLGENLKGELPTFQEMKDRVMGTSQAAEGRPVVSLAEAMKSKPADSQWQPAAASGGNSPDEGIGGMRQSQMDAYKRKQGAGEQGGETQGQAEARKRKQERGEGLHTVAKGESLSKIAGDELPAGVDRVGYMAAIQAANPEAFKNGANKLAAGASLHMPTAEQAKAYLESADGQAARQKMVAELATGGSAPNFKEKIAERRAMAGGEDSSISVSASRSHGM